MDRTILYKFFEGSATPEEKEQIKTWIESSDENKSQLIKERAIFDAIILSPQIDEKLVKRKTPVRKIVLECIKVAAIALIAILISNIYNNKAFIDIDNNMAMNTITVPMGQRANLRLPDQTDVWLNSRSNIEYPAYFTDNFREVKLDGEAYFEVTKKDDVPFKIETKDYFINVLGTKFNVESYSNSDQFSLALMEGSVEIIYKNNAQEQLVLLPSQKVTCVEGKLVVSPIEDYDEYRWREGLICFKEISFADLMKKFENHYDVKIVIENKSIEDKVFTGKFRITDGVENALKILLKESNYYLTRESNTIYLR